MENSTFKAYNPISATKSVLSKFATFKGRATRSEYWWWVLVFNIVSTVLDKGL